MRLRPPAAIISIVTINDMTKVAIYRKNLWRASELRPVYGILLLQWLSFISKAVR